MSPSNILAPVVLPAPRPSWRAIAAAAVRPLVSHLLHRTFVPEEATTPRQRAEAHRIRYEVYCLELGYEDPTRAPLGLEIDEADGRSRHCLLWHRPSGRYAGCVRLVSTDDDELLPVERTCGSSLAPDWCERHGLTRSKIAEISRLAVRPAFRNGTTRSVLSASLLLSLCAAASIFNHEMDAVVALMRPALARRLCMAGLEFVPIGPAIEHRGLRSPYVCRRSAVERGLGVFGRALLDVLRADLQRSVRPMLPASTADLEAPLEPATITAGS